MTSDCAAAANITASQILGAKMLGMLDRPNAGRLQAMVIAMACVGVYAGPDGVILDEVLAERLSTITDIIMSMGHFPLRTMEDCVSLINAATAAYDSCD